jgi:hypothetical protein
MRGDGGGCGVSAHEYSCALHVTWSQINFGDLTPYLTYEFDAHYTSITLENENKVNIDILQNGIAT